MSKWPWCCTSTTLDWSKYGINPSSGSRGTESARSSDGRLERQKEGQMDEWRLFYSPTLFFWKSGGQKEEFHSFLLYNCRIIVFSSCLPSDPFVILVTLVCSNGETGTLSNIILNLDSNLIGCLATAFIKHVWKKFWSQWYFTRFLQIRVSGQWRKKFRHRLVALQSIPWHKSKNCPMHNCHQ